MQSFGKVTQSASHASAPRRPAAAVRSATVPPRLMRSACACGGSCPRCSGAVAATLQPKLTVNQPGDAFEQEADRVADLVVNGGAHPLTEAAAGAGQIQRMCSDCEEEDKQQTVQRQSGSDADASISPQAQSFIQSMDGGGVSLSDSETEYYESRFGRSFDSVKIHTGGAADKTAKSINARAFTLGSNIAFANGEYDSGSVSGRKLLAHELTHTLQQSSGADYVQRGTAGLLGGKCCNPATRVEWALVGAGTWKKLEPDECTGITEDCDGMTCGGGFYRVDDMNTGSCSTPHNDDAYYAPRRWTPSSAGGDAHSPTAEGSAAGDTPPTYVYDAASTTQCPNGVRTISVDFVTLSGATTSATTELAAANRLYKGCCIQFVAGATPAPESLATTQGWVGGDTDVEVAPGCGAVEAEEKNMYDEATRAHGLSSRFRVFLVQTYSGYIGAGYSLPPYCAKGSASPYVNHAVLQNSSSGATNPLAHEFGHILLNSGVHATAPNLMGPSGGTVLSPTDCATCYSNA